MTMRAHFQTTVTKRGFFFGIARSANIGSG
jgi:hypothetical protein